MTPQELCIRRIEEAGTLTDSTVVRLVEGALDELKATYRRPDERLVALEAVHSAFTARRRRTTPVPFGRFVAKVVGRSQNVLIARVA